MSEVEAVEAEVSAVEQLINQITDGDLNNAEGSFQSLVQDKMADALEAQRIAVAQAIFNDQDGDLEDDSDISDEEIELEDGVEDEIVGDTEDSLPEVEEEETDD
jgi:hypothetical protein